MRIVVPPVLIGERICRISSPVETLLEVEEWTGAWWEPSSLTITTVSQGAPAPEALLIARGVPPEDREQHAGSDQDSLQRQLRPTQPDGLQILRIEESANRHHGRRQRTYSGNARFRRGRTAEATEQRELRREDATTATWTGPFRRATDQDRTDGTGPRIA